jgi:hypothetical protein
MCLSLGLFALNFYVVSFFCCCAQVTKEEDAATSVKKVLSAQRGEFGAEERKGQKEITLADDLEGPVKCVIALIGLHLARFTPGLHSVDLTCALSDVSDAARRAAAGPITIVCAQL